MKNLRNATILSFLAVAAFGNAHTDAAAVKSFVQTEMNKCAKAAMMHDIKAFSMHIKENFSPNCMYKTLAGKQITIDAWLAQVGQMFGMTTSVKKAEIKATNVKVKGDMAWVTGTFSYDAWIMKDGKKAHLQVWETAGHTLIEKDGKWWVTLAVQKSAKWLLDGKPWMPTMAK